jgi:hypothetical protein
MRKVSPVGPKVEYSFSALVARPAPRVPAARVGPAQETVPPGLPLCLRDRPARSGSDSQSDPRGVRDGLPGVQARS